MLDYCLDRLEADCTFYWTYARTRDAYITRPAEMPSSSAAANRPVFQSLRFNLNKPFLINHLATWLFTPRYIVCRGRRIFVHGRRCRI
ncbi:hypothetical protein L6452_02694 [Arctium lappa]|uniref:Uncharacterized protein n=1 Tax=Arctium lappa TaxID=4217 RepID=A0ACB9FK95_ARCLA|nr:hypothetical protein L6452_02694 [Arctium lappa]